MDFWMLIIAIRRRRRPRRQSKASWLITWRRRTWLLVKTRYSRRKLSRKILQTSINGRLIMELTFCKFCILPKIFWFVMDCLEITSLVTIINFNLTCSWLSCNFRRTSDDPMISSVNQETDHHENELLRADSTSTSEAPTTPQSPTFEVITSKQSHKSEYQMSHVSESLTTQTVKTQRSVTRARRKGPIKLRFHHQALPVEYLNHYESQQNRQEGLRQQQQQQQSSAAPKKKAPTKALAPPPVAEKTGANGEAKMSNESIISWLQNILEMQSNDDTKPLPKIRNIPVELAPAPTSSRTQCLKDLPYMGEMTLENMKPRRGRKPKKADICHLIYKNYGTIVPGSTAPTASTSSVTNSLNVKKVNEATRKRPSPLAPKKIRDTIESSQVKSSIVTRKGSQNEPLNLCVRESKLRTMDSSIVISDNEDSNEQVRVKPIIDAGESDSIDLEFASTIPSLISPLDLSGDLPAASKDFFRQATATPPLSSSTSTPTAPSVSGAPPGYVYWPSAGLFIHPMALYYQKMMDGKLNQDSSTSSSTSSLSSILNNEANALWEQNMSSLDLKNPDFDMENLSQRIKSESLMNSPPPALAEMLRDTSLDSKKLLNSQKRKRSAIFIPPVQTETSATNPTNEVSICKFKFTGGAKPSLQEKKILSVDAGGNFRYFSGTGDKSMRGYEFFPRESLRQSSLATGSHTNAFLNTASEKIPLDLLPTISVDLNNKLLNLTTDVDTSKILDGSYSIEPEDVQMKGDDRLNRRKKSSNRSIQRAKLEKTFKEKGFLIQTQQLQSAEGATYCKFRQLRKFTRYLFRSWKDYLPTDENAPKPIERPAGSLPAANSP